MTPKRPDRPWVARDDFVGLAVIEELEALLLARNVLPGCGRYKQRQRRKGEGNQGTRCMKTAYQGG